MTNVNPEQVFLTVPSQFYLGPKPDTIDIRQGIFVVATIGDLTVTTINGVPLPGGTFVTTTAVQTLSNKSLVDVNTTFINSVDNTKQMRFSLAGATAGTLTQININSVVGRTYSIPDSGANANFVMTEGNQSINGVKTFLGTISFASIGATATTNQAVFGTGTTVTLNAPTPAANRIYTMPDVGANANFVMTEGNQSINGVKTFIGTISFASVGATATTNQIVMGTGTTVTINAPTPAANRIYTLPDIGTDANFVLTAGTQTVGGLKTFTSTVTITPLTNQIVVGTGTTTTLDFNVPAVSRVYSIPDAGANTSFVLSAGTQNISGAKTFSLATTISAVSNQLVLGSGNTVTVNGAAPAAGRIYTMADVGSNANFVMTEGAQTINGLKTFTSAIGFAAISGTNITLTDTSNQLFLGTGNTVTVTAPTPAASVVYTMPDVGGSASFVMTAGAQSIGGVKTFTSNMVISSATSSTSVVSGALTTGGGVGVNNAIYSRGMFVSPPAGLPFAPAGTDAGISFISPTDLRLSIPTGVSFTVFDFASTLPLSITSATGVATDYSFTAGTSVISPLFRTATGSMTISTTTTSGAINLVSARTDGVTGSFVGPVAAPFGLTFGNQTNNAVLFQANGANEYVPTSVASDIGIQTALNSMAILFGTIAQRFLTITQSGVTFPNGTGAFDNVYVSSGLSTLANFQMGLTTLNLTIRWSRAGFMAMLAIEAGTTTSATGATWQYTNPIAAFPSYMWPAQTITHACMVAIGGSALNGQISVTTTGVITFQPCRSTTVSGVLADFAGAFPAGVATGLLNRQNISYLVGA
jgi:hypothetical protein